MIKGTRKELLEKVGQHIKNCKKCSLYLSRNVPVVGQGNPNAKLVMIGEAPGENEDRTGLPFCGQAGRTLDELFKAAGLDRKEIYLTNILKCHPPFNRDPKIGEIKICSPFLDFQLQVINPKTIVTLGRFSMNYILKKYGLPSEQISKAHGEVFRIKDLFKDLKIIPMYHPAAISYKPSIRKDMLEDFKKLKKIIDNEKE